VQRTFDDLGTPLSQVTFCVVDLETTGGSAERCGITEVGAVKVRGGEFLGTFQSLVNPGVPIPPEITVLTGITQAMVLPAPRIEPVLAAFEEFSAGTVIVGHNVRFDLSFLAAARRAAGWSAMTNPWVDTCALARRLVRDEVANCRLSTLARSFRLSHQPSHRALDDALATTDLLHLLLERAAAFGVLGLDDLLSLPRINGHPQAAKLRLTDRLPRRPGVYLFRDAGGRPLYVGKAANLRQRVRSYFSSDDRRKIGQLLRETQQIDHIPCTGPLDAAVLEVRLIHRLQPRFNRQGKQWGKYSYVKLTLNERFPRLAVVRQAKADGARYVGPLPSASAARRVVEAIETVMPLRRCTTNPGKCDRPAPCAPAQLGVATCPCSGAISEADYRVIVERTERGLTVSPDVLLDPLRGQMTALADAERFEEAADVRDRAEALAGALRRQRHIDQLRDAGTVVVERPGAFRAEVRDGVLLGCWPVDADPTLAGVDELESPPAGPVAGLPLPADLVDEMGCIARWLDAEAARVRVVHCEGGLASAFPPIASMSPRVRNRNHGFDRAR
jgi:DNA polymerase III subunit epsilon